MIYFSALLKPQLPDFCLSLESILKEYKIEYSFLRYTKDIWCRDYMPIETGRGNFVLFRYYPSYLKGVSDLRTDNKLVCEKEDINYTFSNIIIDGGNVIKLNDKAILTDRIFRENKVKKGDLKLIKKLEKLLQAELIIIPAEQDDVVGHADGMMRFLDSKTVFVNNYTSTKSSVSFQNELHRALYKANLEIIPIPYLPDEKWIPKHKYDIAPATGVYINYLQDGNTMLLPQFNIPSDIIALELFSKYYETVIPLDCLELSQQGGLLNCISWNIDSQSSWE